MLKDKASSFRQHVRLANNLFKGQGRAATVGSYRWDLFLIGQVTHEYRQRTRTSASDSVSSLPPADSRDWTLFLLRKTSHMSVEVYLGCQGCQKAFHIGYIVTIHSNFVLDRDVVAELPQLERFINEHSYCGVSISYPRIMWEPACDDFKIVNRPDTDYEPDRPGVE